MRRPDWIAATALALLVSAGGAAAQTAPAAAPASLAEPQLKFEREVFPYPSAGRPDPFAVLTREDDGPRFEELTLRGVIVSDQQGQSVALIGDGGGKVYRLRRGQAVGNARILEIQASSVTFAVENFGIVRREILELKKQTSEGANG